MRVHPNNLLASRGGVLLLLLPRLPIGLLLHQLLRAVLAKHADDCPHEGSNTGLATGTQGC